MPILRANLRAAPRDRTTSARRRRQATERPSPPAGMVVAESSCLMSHAMAAGELRARDARREWPPKVLADVCWDPGSTLLPVVLQSG